MLEIMYNNDKNINQLVSPMSLTYALAMLQNGASGETRNQILDILNYKEPLDNSVYNEVMNVFNYLETSTPNEMPKAIVKIGNALWLRKDLTPVQSFVDTLKSKYDADVYQSDFTSLETVDIMNKWVEDHTNGLLKKTFENFESSTVAVLVNTLYFKGNWKKEFSESMTTEMPFELNDGIKKDVDMMRNESYYPYIETESAQILSMDYYGGLRMLVYLPKENLNEFFSDSVGQSIMLSGENAGFNSAKVAVYFPKFDFQSNNNLNEILKVMGMTLPFNEEKADFSEMIVDLEGNVFINKIIQNTRIIVDETGTEAAAVTAVEMEATSAMPEVEEPIEFKCDHPFIIVIQDPLTGVNLFMGIVNDPSE